MPYRVGFVAVALTFAAVTTWAQPRVWIADQGDNHGFNNRILEIDPINHNPSGPDGSDVYILNTLPSPAGAFLDELSFDDQQRLWCVVKDEPDQDPDGARRIDKETGAIDDPPGLITPTFPGEAFGGFLEGMAWDGVSLWVSAVRDGLAGNMLTRVDPLTGARIAPFVGAGPVGAAGKANIPGSIAQGLLWEPGGGHGWLWHSDWGDSRIYKLDVSRLFDNPTYDPTDPDGLKVAEFPVPFKPKGMDWMEDKIWVASPGNTNPAHNGIWEFDPSTGSAQQLFTTPSWNLDGLATLEEPPGPKIVLSTETIARSVWIGNNLSNDTFDVANGGTDTLNYGITDDVGWLDSLPASGSSTGEADPITVSYSVSSLPVGAHQAVITVTGNAYNSPQTIAVTVTVETVKPDLDGDADVDQEDFGLFQVCYTGPGVPPTGDCVPADFSGDGDVDLYDFAVFRACQSGANTPADPQCDD